ncbi:hypothetical protein VB713_26760 [Anabaena cylindrica UHCC 0172]|uniref:hypothetical protein n=1 Tax=Anabaena cylindrica TaxID=1165 RepID=UPI002B1F8C6F|nr:hypothetical protein [Anabaena cylindrica]MEA5554537.1 hypothetical protein [Anabaena cylindrica UHCC 0172]
MTTEMLAFEQFALLKAIAIVIFPLQPHVQIINKPQRPSALTSAFLCVKKKLLAHTRNRTLKTKKCDRFRQLPSCDRILRGVAHRS